MVLSYDQTNEIITVYNSNSTKAEITSSIAQFMDVWNDSKSYLVIIKTVDMKNYEPKPIDLSDVELTEDLNELREAIAENAHEIWAENRKKDGHMVYNEMMN